MQGVVNNAYYHNLLEQTRAEFFESIDIDTKEWSQKYGIDFVVYETTIQYRSPIQAGETFRSCLNISRMGARFVFHQEFRRLGSNTLCIKARVDVVQVINGKLSRGDHFTSYLEGAIQYPIPTNGGVTRTNTKNEEEWNDSIFNYEMKVRDYECNRFGSATNTFIQHYLEETRLEFMESVGETFRKWHESGIDMMVSKVDLKFIRPMMSSERFHSLMNVRQEGPRLIFFQEIRHKKDYKPCVRAIVEVVGLKNGELSMGEVFDEFMQTQVPAWMEKVRENDKYR